MRRGVEAEGLRGFFADEGIVVYLGEAKIHEKIAHFMLELAFGIRRRYGSGDARRLGRNGIVAHHAAYFFHQIVLDRYILGGAPRRNRHAEYARSWLA